MLDGTTHGETEALAALASLVRGTGYAFVTPTPATHGRVLARDGGAWARDLRDVFGWSRAFRAEAVGDDIFGAMQVAGVAVREGEGWRSSVRFSTLDGLLVAHSAYPTTAADAVFFGPDTYRFGRAIVAAMASRLTVARAVDVGCGAGPGAMLVARAWPGAEVVGVDINAAALRLTRVNAAVNGVAVTAVRSDLLDGVEGEFDLIVSNPPYLVDPGERAYRHGGGPLGAGLSLRILEASLGRLAPGGTLVLYTGAAIVNGTDPFHAAALDRLAGRKVAARYEEVDPDVFGEELEGGVYVGAERIAAVVLTVQRQE